MESPRYCIGIDGGGTKTAAEICDLKGQPLASAKSGPSNFQVIGVDAAARTILDLILTCCTSVGCTLDAIGSVVCGLTGAGRASDQRRMEEGIRNEAFLRQLTLKDVGVESDARIALEAAFLGRPGVVVISGTGSIVFGKDAKGRIHRAGGWGRLIGDEGSAYSIGRELFRSVAASIDGKSSSDTLRRMLGTTTGFRTQEQIINALYKEGFDIASVAPLVSKAAAKGDTTARAILRSAAADLVDVIRPVVSIVASVQGRKERVPVAYLGSVLTSGGAFTNAVDAMLKKQLPRVQVKRTLVPLVHGASLMALARLRP